MLFDFLFKFWYPTPLGAELKSKPVNEESGSDLYSMYPNHATSKHFE